MQPDIVNIAATLNQKDARLERFHTRRHAGLTIILPIALLGFALWASYFRIDEVARASGEIITGSRVQVIQTVDGGVLATLAVEEGDRVTKGQVLATLDEARAGASVAEIDARLYSLHLKAARLRAEVTGAGQLSFNSIREDTSQADVENALFEQRALGLAEELRTLQVSAKLAQRELAIVHSLEAGGDVGEMEMIKAERAVNESEASLANRKNEFLESARIELADVEDEIAQAAQILAGRAETLAASIFSARMPGIVKNIRVTTLGGVLAAGEEIMQIVPVDDALLLEVKVSPADIARVRPGLDATVRLDPFDYTIYGGVSGKVTYVSADTIKEDTTNGQETFYRVRIEPKSMPAVTTTGRTLEIQPGMTAQVDIRTGDRTLVDFLLKPLRKTLSDSFGER